MIEYTLIFPNQLFRDHPALNKERRIILIEDPLFFGDIKYPLKFHKQKLAYHRASMKFYKKWLIDKGYDVKYIEYANLKTDLRSDYLTVLFNKLQIKKIHYAEVTDFILSKRIKSMGVKLNKELVVYDSPMFICTEKYVKEFFREKSSYFMNNFYINQRKRLNILMNGDKPVGGKWSFDKENRKALKKEIEIPKVDFPDESDLLTEARRYVEKNFKDNPGENSGFNYPVTFKDADEWLDQFLKNRFYLFGDYEDAIEVNQHFLFHSVLTPMLNTGLLTPQYVIDKILQLTEKNNVPLNSLEGFIRQIIGWREYMRAIYLLEGVNQRRSNYFNFKKKLPEAFYTATTGIEPVDNTINKLLKSAYNHHIERLMILGNFMLLSEINPTEIYNWFMEMYIDSYDWVMVPNVYGMSQYADGGLICTKPYISSSNYIRKMGNYKKGEWCDVWDSLYWRFLKKQRNKLEENPRMKLMYNQLDKMDINKLQKYLDTASRYLKGLR